MSISEEFPDGINDLIFFAVAGPTPKKLSTGSASRNASASLGKIRESPSGLRKSEAIFAKNLLNETPAEAVSPSSERIAARISRAI